MIKEKEFHTDTFRSEILSDACEFEVTISFEGSITELNFPNRPVGPQDLTLAKLSMVLTANNETVRFETAKVEIKSVEPDGTVILAGKSVEFSGVLKTNLETGETTMQSHNVPDPARKA